MCNLPITPPWRKLEVTPHPRPLFPSDDLIHLLLSETNFPPLPMAEIFSLGEGWIFLPSLFALKMEEGVFYSILENTCMQKPLAQRNERLLLLWGPLLS
jgi:hypothetical protein